MVLKNKYFLLRHGETIYQTKKKDFTYPWPEIKPVKLTKKGVSQIKKVANSLKKEKIDLIYSSDIFRARQTAKIVAKILGLEVFFDPRLRDTNLGLYHGRAKQEFYQDFPRIFPLRFIKRPAGGESWKDCQKRIFGFFREIDKKYKGKTILIVSHGDPLWLLEGALKNWSIENFLKTAQPNYLKVGELKKLNFYIWKFTFQK